MSLIYLEQNIYQEKELNESFNSEDSTNAFEDDIEIIKEYNDEIINEELSEKIHLISSSFEKLIENKFSKLNDRIFNLKVFENDEIPTISIQKYIERIIKYTNCEENTLILSLISCVKLIDSELFLV